MTSQSGTDQAAVVGAVTKRPPGRPRNLPLEAQREAVLTAARKVFAEHDFNGATVDGVAREAGVARRAVYELFGGKEELFIEVVDDATRRLIEFMAARMSGRFELPMSELVRSNVAALFEFISEQPDAAAMIRIAEYGGFGPAKVEVAAGRERIEDALAALYMVSWDPQSNIAPESARLLALMTLAMVEAVGFRQPSEPSWDVDDTVSFITQFLVSAFVGLDGRGHWISEFGREP